MTREDIKKILGEGATEEQISNTLNALHNQTNALNKQISELKANESKYSDYEQIKSQLDAINKEKMTEQERIAKDKEETEKNLRESRIIKNKAKVMSVLAGMEIDEDIIDSIVGEDETSSLAKAQKLADKFNNVISDTKKKTEEDMANINVKPNMTNTNPNADNGKMTFEKFGALSAEEQEKFINEHPDEFENL